MTRTGDIVEPTGTESAAAQADCNTCSASLEEGQRYCVQCGARNPIASDPAASHLAAATRDSRLVASARASGGKGKGSPWTVPLMFAVPLALALGLLLGQGGDEDLLKAIKDQPAPVVQVGQGTPTGETRAESGSQAAAAPKKTVRKVLAQSGAGPILDVESYRPSAAKKASDVRAIKRCQSKKGYEFLRCQRTLPDIVGTGTGGGGGDDGGPSGPGD